MEREGPTLESLVHRVTETPEDFLTEPRVGKIGRVHVAAVVHDLMSRLGHQLPLMDLEAFEGADAKRDRNRLAVTLLLCWLLADPWFARAELSTDALLTLLREEADALAEHLAAGKFVTDPDRREELVRLTLARVGYRPAGETKAQAEDRLTTLSSVERSRVLRASRVAEERAAAIRAELARKAAEESADKWGRE